MSSHPCFMRTTKSDYVTLNGVNLAINTASGKAECYTEMLECLDNQCRTMLSHHNKVLFIRLDLRCDRYSPNNIGISRLMDKIRKHLSNKYSCKRMGFFWAREQETSKRQHYHLLLMIDGNKIKHPHNICEWVKARWENTIGNSLYVPKNCYYFVYRGNQEEYNAMFMRASYLTKTRGKGYGGKYAKNYASSRLSPKATYQALY